jgi:toxin ParE1/3/4
MARFRLSQPAQADLAGILSTSLERWGELGERRYRSLLAAALRSVAAQPDGPLTRDRGEVVHGMRSFHVRHTRRGHGVASPVHVIYFRADVKASVEIIRILHERVEPGHHLGTIRAKRRLGAARKPGK